MKIKMRLKALSTSAFRSKFHLKEKEIDIVKDRGLDVVKRHAIEFIDVRLAPAFPKKDGKQTPFRNHPVFIAQHATGTCCRSCLSKWHEIPRGRELTGGEVEFVAEIIMEWINRDMKV